MFRCIHVLFLVLIPGKRTRTHTLSHYYYRRVKRCKLGEQDEVVQRMKRTQTGSRSDELFEITPRIEYTERRRPGGGGVAKDTHTYKRFCKRNTHEPFLCAHYRNAYKSFCVRGDKTLNTHTPTHIHTHTRARAGRLVRYQTTTEMWKPCPSALPGGTPPLPPEPVRRTRRKRPHKSYHPRRFVSYSSITIIIIMCVSDIECR